MAAKLAHSAIITIEVVSCVVVLIGMGLILTVIGASIYGSLCVAR